MSIRKCIILLLLLACLMTAQTRREIRVPDLPGYVTLIGDFHMHTLFSDGLVWPVTRVEEAYREGLDVISITDHVEYRPYSDDIPVQYGRSYEIARPKAEELGILLIKGAEITRNMPPGHLNALFIKEIEPLTHKDPMKAIEIAAMQGAFILWNHPGWSAQLKEDGIVRWYEEHTILFEKGWLKGIELVNEKEYYPEVHQWALDKNLTFFGNSDVHSPIDYLYEPMKGEHRPYTLVFSQDRTLASVHEALENRRTIIYHEDKILGREDLLGKFFAGCLKNENGLLNPEKNGNIHISLENRSDIPLVLMPVEKADFTLAGKVLIQPGSSERVRLSIPIKYREGYHQLDLALKVENFLTAPEKNLHAAIKLDILNIASIGIKMGKRNKIDFAVPGLPDDISLRFTTDGKSPNKLSENMENGLALEADTEICYGAFQKGRLISGIYRKKLNLNQAIKTKIDLGNQPAAKYFGKGAATLIDGLTGTEDYSDGAWLGFEKDDFVAELSFDQAEEVKTIEVRFLESNRSWIFMPKTIRIEVSENGKDFSELFTWKNELQVENSPTAIIPIITKNSGKLMKVRIIAQNQGACPDWHSGAGGNAWLFVDEIILR